MSIKLRIGLILLLFFVLSLLTSSMGASQETTSMVILSPGQNAVVTSPIQLSAILKPGEDGLVRVSLIDQNNQLLVRQLNRWASQGNSHTQFTTQIVFELPSESTQGLITLETQDKYHRPMTTRGVLLTLRSTGPSELQPAPTPEPWITITFPQPYEVISDGEFVVKGIATPITTKPIIFELITETGGVIGSKQLAVENPGDTLTFDVPLSYAYITSTRDVRLIMRQTVDPYGRNIILDSLPLFLTP
jgi:hypothetical protein